MSELRSLAPIECEVRVHTSAEYVAPSISLSLPHPEPESDSHPWILGLAVRALGLAHARALPHVRVRARVPARSATPPSICVALVNVPSKIGN